MDELGAQVPPEAHLSVACSAVKGKVAFESIKDLCNETSFWSVEGSQKYVTNDGISEAREEKINSEVCLANV